MKDVVGRTLSVNGEQRSIAKVLWSEEKIRQGVHSLAQLIAEHYEPLLEKEPNRNLVLVVILNGAIPFATDLLRELSKLLPPDRLRYDTLAISSYGRGTKSSELRIEKDLKNPVANDFVVIVEDIIDTGYTAKYFRQLLLHKGAFDVKVCTLVFKTARIEHEVDPDFKIFDLEENLFIVGYGLDWADMCRSLPFIVALSNP
jgi:hypoxanthine phosphoribosyltransferase